MTRTLGHSVGNTTFVLMSTKPREQPDGSPCLYIMSVRPQLTVAGHGDGEVDVDGELGVVVGVGHELEVVAGAQEVASLRPDQGSHQERRHDGH